MLYVLILFILLQNPDGSSLLDRDTTAIRFQNLGIEEGLSQSGVKSLFQDSKGYLWFGTQDGLDRYDGYSFRHFKPGNDPMSIAGKLITGIAEDNSGAIWISTHNGVSRLNLQENSTRSYYHNTRNNTSLPSNHCTDILSDSLDRIWVASDNGVSRYNRETDSFDKIPFLEPDLYDSQPQRLFDIDGRIWCLGLQSTLAIYDEDAGGFTRFDHPIMENIYVATMLEDENHIYFAGGHNRIYKLSKDNGQIQRYYPQNVGDLSLIHDMDIDSIGRVWAISRDGSALVYSPSSDSFEVLGKLQFSVERTISIPLSTIICDDSGVIWVGSNGFGVYSYSPYRNKFVLISDEVDANLITSGSYIYSLYQEEENLWIGSFDHGMERMNLTTGESTSLNVPTERGDKQYGITILYEDTLGRLWFLPRYKAAFEIDKETDTWRMVELPEAVTAIATLSTGEIAVGYGTDDIVIYPDVNSLFQPGEYESIRAPVFLVTCISEVRPGTIWIGSENGLAEWDRSTNQFKLLKADAANAASLPNSRIKNITILRDGTIAVGTMGGLALKNPGDEDFQSVTINDGLPNDAIFALQEDYRGIIWLATSKGLVLWDRQAMEFTHYVSEDGLQNNEFNTNASFQAADGSLFFGGINGISACHPSNIPKNNTPPEIVVTSFKVMGKEHALIRNQDGALTVSLDHDESYINISFAALDYTNPQKNQFKYRMLENDEAFLPLGNQRNLNFDLSPGVSTLEIAGTNSDGVWSEKNLLIRIEVRPPFWQTPLFIGAVIALIIVGTVLAILYSQRRNRQMRERLAREVSIKTKALAESNKELEAFNYMVSHDLQTPLMNLTHYIHMLREHEPQRSGKTANGSISGRMHKIVMRMRRLVSDLLLFSRSNASTLSRQSCQLHMLAKEVVSEIRENNPDADITFTCDADSTVYADPDFIQIAIRNIISNAVKYAPDSNNIQITMNIEEQSGMQLVRIADNGTSIPDQSKQQVFKPFIREKISHNKEGTGIGLAIVDRIIRRHSGDVWVEDTPGGGTTLVFTLPKNH